MSNQARIDNLTWSRADVKRHAQYLKGRLDALIRDMDDGYTPGDVDMIATELSSDFNRILINLGRLKEISRKQ